MNSQSEVGSAPAESVEPVSGDDEGTDWGSYPLDSVMVRNEVRTVSDIIRRMAQQRYIMDPEFQRSFVWEPKKQSRLIESILMRIPLPVFYLAEQADGRLVVVDGLQRLSTLQRFIQGKLTLDLINQDLSGKKFTDLSPKLQNRIEDTNLTLFVLDSKMPERARLDIFERVNSGVPINRQQMRNCLYTGTATRWLKDMAESDEFRQATVNSLASKRARDQMLDREFVNHFCAFRLIGYQQFIDKYKGEIDTFLADSLRAINENKLPGSLDAFTEEFKRSMVNNYEIFGRHAFRKHQNLSDPRSLLNTALFDAFSVLMVPYSTVLVTKHKAEVESGFQTLMSQQEFQDAISHATNSPRQVERRFLAIERMLKGVLSDVEQA